MAPSTPSTRPTAQIVAEFVTEQLEAHRKAWRDKASHKDSRPPPLVLGVQGPQGSGKSYLASGLPALLASQNPPLRTASLSLDDLYLPHFGLVAVAQANPGNKLLSGRGQAGTHDIALGLECLRAFKARGTAPVELPVFEKSLHGGEGDRLPREKWVKVHNPGEVDVVVFEGWMNGFRPLPPPPSTKSLSSIYALAHKDRQQARVALGIDYDEPFFLQHDLVHLEKVQENLAAYEELWSMVDAFVQIKPEKMGYVWEWRLEQEHNMKAKNGGIGMTDEQVQHFIARYMPGYEVFLRGIEHPSSTWTAKGLRVVIGKMREVKAVERF
ncbi:D-glycerate 3-kinase [Rhodotorula toruloides]|uniref:D-glycerate 3-kinase n=1 Tax=Rhodotorula toruloides TaxID=5286 RepID=A0A511KIZ3_RHOTO|nr:D-glycerate 3-kinase [Rhodotorula toruloides]